MARLFNGTSDGLLGGSSPVSAVPATLAAWVKPDVIPDANTVILGIYDNVSSNPAIDIRLGGTGDTGTIIFRNNSAVGNAVGATTVLPTTAFSHVLGTVNSTGGVVIYHNGVEEGSDLDSVTTTASLTRCSVGYRSINNDSYFDGSIAEAAVWNRVLSATEIAALGKGFSPLWFPQGLVFYQDLIRNLDRPGIGPSLSLVSAPSVVSHPLKIIYPTRRHFIAYPNPSSLRHHRELDEKPFVDSDFVESANAPNGDAFEIEFENFTKPSPFSRVEIEYRYAKAGLPGQSITAKLFSGQTEIASWTHTDAATAFKSAIQVLNQTQIDQIGTPPKLRLRFSATTQ